ncbi:uncharacterized protein LOC128549711 isoform X2 [Mercenaria mercenaria]|uniref:uncharacterized protein LOC128549711 isoform X2 n=1 Tax=Mercenaria mercenaria TaxID=6596 RepID=UPI00234E85CA|nr:uncharacterized protein LOC128549711 isoform X2 [Mercenaria mercenaria]
MKKIANSLSLSNGPLRKWKPEIKKNLNLDEDILDTLEARNTLSGENVAKIKTERTHSEKISKLLFILQRKGPDAFQDFIDAINPAYKFLADKLMERYHEEVKKLDREFLADSGNSSEGSPEPTENAKSDISNAAKEPVSPSRKNPPSLPHVEQNHTHTINRSNRNELMHVQLPPESHSLR